MNVLISKLEKVRDTILVYKTKKRGIPPIKIQKLQQEFDKLSKIKQDKDDQK